MGRGFGAEFFFYSLRAQAEIIICNQLHFNFDNNISRMERKAGYRLMLDDTESVRSGTLLDHSPLSSAAGQCQQPLLQGQGTSELEGETDATSLTQMANPAANLSSILKEVDCRSASLESEFNPEVNGVRGSKKSNRVTFSGEGEGA